MNKKAYHKYLRSPEWSKIRFRVLTRDEYKCRLCNSELDLNVHHRSYQNLGNELNHLNDLIALCKRCHSHFHGKLDKPLPTVNHTKKQRYRVPAPLPLIPDQNIITLTKESMDLLRTPAGGFTNKTVQALGVDNTKKKWINKLYGTTITRDQFILAAKGRTMWSTEPSPFIAI